LRNSGVEPTGDDFLFRPRFQHHGIVPLPVALVEQIHRYGEFFRRMFAWLKVLDRNVGGQ
jgi:hypothetical protein